MMEDISMSITFMRWYWPVHNRYPKNNAHAWRAGPFHLYIRFKGREK